MIMIIIVITIMILIMICAPQVKCLRVLQYFPPPEDPVVGRALNEVLRRVITGSEVAKNVNKNNAQHAIVFEAIALALALEADPELLTAGGYIWGFPGPPVRSKAVHCNLAQAQHKQAHVLVTLLDRVSDYGSVS